MPQSRCCYRLSAMVFCGLLLVWSGAVRAADPLERAGQQLDELDARFWEELERGNYDQARKIIERQAAIARKFADDAPNWATFSIANQAELYSYQGRLAEAERLYADVVKQRKEIFGEQDSNYALALNGLAGVFLAQGRAAQAERLFADAVEIIENEYGAGDVDAARIRTNLAEAQVAQGRYSQAERHYLRAIEVYEDSYGKEAAELIPFLRGLGQLHFDRSRYENARVLYERARQIAEASGGADHPNTARCLQDLAAIDAAAERPDAADKKYEQALRTFEAAFGPQDTDVAECLRMISRLRQQQGRFAEAEQSARRALNILESIHGPIHPSVAGVLTTLAETYLAQSRYPEAEALYRRARSIFEQAGQADGMAPTYNLVGLATVFANQGRFAEADRLLLDAEANYRRALGEDSYDLADTIFIRAQLLSLQGRHAEAGEAFRKSLAIFERILPAEDSTIGYVHLKMSSDLLEQDHYAAAEREARLAHEVLRKRLSEEHPNVIEATAQVAITMGLAGKYDDARPLFEKAKDGYARTFGGDIADLAYVLGAEARILWELGRDAEAEPLVDRAIALSDRGGLAPTVRSEGYLLRARIAWRDSRKSEALADLRQAMDLAEQQRGMIAGAERERAGFFGKHAETFEQMVEWQVELGDVTEGLAAMERARARSLLDELSRQGVDLQIGLSSAQREELNRRETELKSRVAELERQIDAAAKGDRATAELLVARLSAELVQAKADLYQHFRDARSANPVYQNLLSVGAAAPRLSQIRSRIVGEDGLLLVYLLGTQGGYVAAVDPRGARLERLSLDEQAAQVLASQAGPLTSDRTSSILMNEQRSGVLQQLKDPARAGHVSRQLATLWRVLIPEAYREELASGKVKRLIVVPDGPLGLLPFDALVVSEGPPPRYLLDVGPPVIYGPSASVLYNLEDRRVGGADESAEPVLTVGDPAYVQRAEGQLASRSDGLDAQLAAGARYSFAGGSLTRLPYSGTESNWVLGVFQNQGMAAAQLVAANATEANVRRLVAGRRIVHLACHGLADQAHGNFFGALALTPGAGLAGSPPAEDDGYLTFAEIYDLDLRSCELAILSACETNYGPEQRGEGIWGISRSFLVAGARRAVASNWLVDDEAAASLISYFCGGIALAESRGATADYALALQNAKRWVRQQEKWQSPYYWATFVLVGPQ